MSYSTRRLSSPTLHNRASLHIRIVVLQGWKRIPGHEQASHNGSTKQALHAFHMPKTNVFVCVWGEVINTWTSETRRSEPSTAEPKWMPVMGCE